MIQHTEITGNADTLAGLRFYALCAPHWRLVVTCGDLLQPWRTLPGRTACFRNKYGMSPDRPGARMYLGRPTGAAKPLMWAQAEYVKLLRSIHDQRVFDFIPEVANRYIRRAGCQLLEIWKPNRRVRTVKRGWMLRIQAPVQFMLHWSLDEWQTTQDTHALSTAIGIYFVDLLTPPDQRAPIRFTFYWKHESRWAGVDHAVHVIA